MLRWSVLSAFCLVLAADSMVRAETTVELKGVHLCCKNCVNGVAAILKKIDGVEGKCNTKDKTVTITAPDDKTAQKALDALAAGGYHGTTGNKDLSIKNDSGVTAGKVKSLVLQGAHNCCPSCCKANKATLQKVEGVTEDTVKPRGKTFEVTGDFDAAAVVAALNAAGFHVQLKK
jgi:copper chaperone CopZ